MRVVRAKPLGINSRLGWAAYYDRRPGPDAEHLCYWYLLLHHAFD